MRPQAVVAAVVDGGGCCDDASAGAGSSTPEEGFAQSVSLVKLVLSSLRQIPYNASSSRMASRATRSLMPHVVLCKPPCAGVEVDDEAEFVSSTHSQCLKGRRFSVSTSVWKDML